MGWRDMTRGRHEAAERLFQRSLDINPKDVYALWSFYNLSCRRHDVSAMDDYKQRLTEAAPTNPFLEALPIGAAMADGRMKEARSHAEAFLNKPATDWDQFDRMCGVADAFLNYGYPGEAIPYLEEAAKLPKSGRNPRANRLLGECYMRVGEYAKAEAALTQATSTTLPRNLPHVLLATLYLQRGELDAAERELAAARRIRPRVAIDKTHALVHMARGNHADARLLAERSVAADSTRASHELLAWVLISGDLDVEHGLREAEVAQSLDLSTYDRWQFLPTWPILDYSLGLAYLKQGKPRDAVKHLELAAKASPARASISDDLKRAKAALAESP
jgi:tetratricopeptide (TPR) repeat protein